MKIEKITVRAGRVVPHPLHTYGNLKADLEVVAKLDPGDDPDKVREQLQREIESDVEQHMADLKDGIRDLQLQTNTRARIAQLESDLASKSAELNELQGEFEERPLLRPKT